MLLWTETRVRPVGRNHGTLGLDQSRPLVVDVLLAVRGVHGCKQNRVGSGRTQLTALPSLGPGPVGLLVSTETLLLIMTDLF